MPDNPMTTSPHYCRRCGVDLLTGRVCGSCCEAAEAVDAMYEGERADHDLDVRKDEHAI